MTVPTGMSRICAASAYVKSPMSTSTITSRKSCGTADSAATMSSWRQALDDPLLVEVAVAGRRLEPVVEEVVALLQRLRLRRALRAAAAIDVEVGQDAEQPGAEVRAGREAPPAPESACIGLLHQVLGLLRVEPTSRLATRYT